MVKSVDERVDELRQAEAAVEAERLRKINIEAQAAENYRQEQARLAEEKRQAEIVKKQLAKEQQKSDYAALVAFGKKVEPLVIDAVPLHAQIWRTEDLTNIFEGEDGLFSKAFRLAVHFPLKVLFELGDPQVLKRRGSPTGSRPSLQFSFDNYERIIISGSNDKPGFYNVDLKHYYNTPITKSSIPEGWGVSRTVWHGGAGWTAEREFEKLQGVPLEPDILEFLLDKAAKAKLMHEKHKTGNRIKNGFTAAALATALLYGNDYWQDRKQEKAEKARAEYELRMKEEREKRPFNPYYTPPPTPPEANNSPTTTDQAYRDSIFRYSRPKPHELKPYEEKPENKYGPNTPER